MRQLSDTHSFQVPEVFWTITHTETWRIFIKKQYLQELFFPLLRSAKIFISTARRSTSGGTLLLQIFRKYSIIKIFSVFPAKAKFTAETGKKPTIFTDYDAAKSCAKFENYNSTDDLTHNFFIKFARGPLSLPPQRLNKLLCRFEYQWPLNVTKQGRKEGKRHFTKHQNSSWFKIPSLKLKWCN
jgi:hypothetical protein